MSKAQEASLTERLLAENRRLMQLCWRAAESAKEYGLVGGVFDELRNAGEESGYGYCAGCDRDRSLTAWVDGRWACSEHLTSGRDSP